MPSPYQYQSGLGGGTGGSYDSSSEITNLSLSTSVSANALTIFLKGKNGSDPSTTNIVRIGFRNSTASTGTYVQRTVTASLSITVSSGSTLGTQNNKQAMLYVYALDNSGAVELAVINGQVDEGSLQTSTAEGGAGAADSAQVLYSTTARTSKAVRLIGRILITQTTAGTWASNATEIALVPFRYPSVYPRITKYTSGSGTFTPNAETRYLIVTMIGAGGGGSGSSTTAANNAGAGGNGGSTTFGSHTASGGDGSAGLGNNGGSGGSSTLGSNATGLEVVSGGDGVSSTNTSSAAGDVGGNGGSSSLGGAGRGGPAGTNAGAAGKANTGGGGGGAGASTSSFTGGGGGSGGYLRALITTIESSYSYSVGTSGTGGTAGTGGAAGGAGGSGMIIIEEY